MYNNEDFLRYALEGELNALKPRCEIFGGMRWWQRIKAMMDQEGDIQVIEKEISDLEVTLTAEELERRDDREELGREDP